MRVLTVFGTRPEAIKMAPVVRALANEQTIESRVCVTAQHRQMLDQVLQAFAIEPDYDLDLMKAGQDLTYVTTAVLEGLRPILQDFKPDRILVQGDTTTSFVAGLAAFYEKVSVGHIEAGLRTGNIYSPFPEEMNRKMTTALTDLHFPPTEESRQNLLREGVPDDRIVVTGNTVIDALFEALALIDETKSEAYRKEFPFADGSRRLILVTGHRRENFGDGLARVCQGLVDIADHENVVLAYPAHPNPNVQAAVKDAFKGRANIILMPPLDYLPFLYLLKRSYLVITDSGGIQEEAPSLGKPVLVTRDTTERPEAVTAGTVKLVGTDRELLVSEASKLLEDPKEYDRMSVAHNPYGDGKAATRIVECLVSEQTQS